ncbi:nucleoside deaminase [Acetobacteraceae bacterium ESL0709]|nr:nucleoside deaminase [Acetobacteraceae bacterium ESL0697]MDF7678773.1 nucleoside deaminase [Acetobacteraceae bacterium ESL0709]
MKTFSKPELNWSTPMREALSLAHQAAQRGEVPVGALVIDGKGQILARAHNMVEACYDASAHAEILALRQAAHHTRSARLTDCTLVVTLEPCVMCAAAISHFRLHRVVYGAYDPKGGGVDHGPRLFARPGCLHRPQEIISGLCEGDSATILRQFFGERRL